MTPARDARADCVTTIEAEAAAIEAAAVAAAVAVAVRAAVVWRRKGGGGLRR